MPATIPGTGALSQTVANHLSFNGAPDPVGSGKLGLEDSNQVPLDYRILIRGCYLK
jgi:hypothetical protein